MFGHNGILRRLASWIGWTGQFAGSAENTTIPAAGEERVQPYPKRVWADFNGLFRGGEILCLSHKDTSVDEDGNTVKLYRGMQLTAYMEDLNDDGKRDDLIASGIVQASPEWLQCRGSKWVLLIDENGVQHESEIEGGEQPSA